MTEHESVGIPNVCVTVRECVRQIIWTGNCVCVQQKYDVRVYVNQ